MPKQPDLQRADPAALGRPAVRPGAPDDRFFRHIVDSMRNGVLAIRRDGSVALINDEAYRIFGLERRDEHLGMPLTKLLGDRPGDGPESGTGPAREEHATHVAALYPARLRDP